MNDYLTIGLACTLIVVVLLSVVLGIRTFLYQESVEQRFDNLFTKE